MAETDFTFFETGFQDCVNNSAKVEQIWTGGIWTEGPAWFPAQQMLVWSDIPNNRMMRWDPASGAAGVFRSPSDYANGHTIDRRGRLVSCEQGTRRVTRTEHDGAITVLADRFKGKRFNSPNDVVVKSDGSIWFTDPAYGIFSDFEGYRAQSEIGGDHVYRIDPHSGEIAIVADDFCRPNGLAFSPDESLLYIVDSGGSRFPDDPRHIRRFAVGANGTLSGGGIFANCPNGAFDGIRLDEFGRVWASAMDGIYVYEPDGTLLGRVNVPEEVSNLCFGGPRMNRLFITATSSVYSVLLPVKGARTI